MDYVDLILRILLLLLALGGLGLCSRFILDQYQNSPLVLSRPKLSALTHKLGPIATSLETKQPLSYAKYPESRLLGFPNWYPGVPFYLITLLSALWSNTYVVGVALLLSIFATVFSIILFLVNRFSLKAKCPSCTFIHLINLAIFAYWLLIAINS